MIRLTDSALVQIHADTYLKYGRSLAASFLNNTNVKYDTQKFLITSLNNKRLLKNTQKIFFKNQYTLNGRIHLKNVTQKVIRLEQVSISIAIKKIVEVINKMQYKFYGAILRTNFGIFNLTEPLSFEHLIEVSNEFRYSLDTPIGNLYLYFYDDIYADQNFIFNKKLKNITNPYAVILAANQQYIHKNKNENSMKLQNNFLYYSFNSQTITVQSEVSTKDVFFYDNDVFKYYIAPIPILSDGIIAPFYGALLIKYSNCTTNSTAINLLPHLSANVSFSSIVLNKLEQNIFTFSSVCTGSNASNTFEGLSTLAFANLSSPLNVSNIGINHVWYSKIAINTCLHLYQKYKLIEKNTYKLITLPQKLFIDIDNLLNDAVNNNHIIVKDIDEKTFIYTFFQYIETLPLFKNKKTLISMLMHVHTKDVKNFYNKEKEKYDNKK